MEPKKHEYSQQTRQLSLKLYYSGISARGVARILNINKSNVANWIKKQKNHKEKVFGAFRICGTG